MEKYISVDNIDSYYEQVVKRKMSTSTVTKLVVGLIAIVTSIVVGVILMVTVADWLLPLILVMFGLGCYLIYYIIKHSRVEYEYTFVLGELRISKIKGRAKRRNVTYFDVKNIDDIGKYIDPDTGKRTIDPSKYPNLLHAAADDYDLSTYYFIIHDKVRKKPAVLLLTPNEKTFSMIRPYLSVELKKKFLKMQKDDELIRSSANTQKQPEEKKAEVTSGQADGKTSSKEVNKTDDENTSGQDRKTAVQENLPENTKAETSKTKNAQKSSASQNSTKQQSPTKKNSQNQPHKNNRGKKKAHQNKGGQSKH